MDNTEIIAEYSKKYLRQSVFLCGHGFSCGSSTMLNKALGAGEPDLGVRVWPRAGLTPLIVLLTDQK